MGDPPPGEAASPSAPTAGDRLMTRVGLASPNREPVPLGSRDLHDRPGTDPEWSCRPRKDPLQPSP